MKTEIRIRTIIIDDKMSDIENLKAYLELMPDVDICGTTTKIPQAIKLITEINPDLIFVDVEMPCKNGMVLMAEIRSKRQINSKIVYYTGHEKYLIEAFRDGAFDILQKPVKEADLKKLMERFRTKRNDPQQNNTSPSVQQLLNPTPLSERLALPSADGLQFVDASKIILFESTTEPGLLKSRASWEVLMHDNTRVRLGPCITAKKIETLVGVYAFMQINQSCIVNLRYVNAVVFKSCQCLLLPPFNNLNLIISRSNMAKFKNQTDFL